MQTGLEKKSVRGKLIITSLLVTGLAIMIGLIISIIDDVRNTQQSTQQQLTILADMMAASSAPALIFKDQQAASDNLQLLHINPLITSAKILDSLGNEFVSYQKKITTESINSVSALPTLADISIERPISLNSESIGLLAFSVDMSPIWNALFAQWLMKLFVLSILFLLSFIILRKSSDYVLGPIHNLANAIREIIDSGNYSLRVENQTVDELGLLTEEFNLMLSKIEDRDNQLQQSNEALAQVQEPIVLRDAQLLCQYVNPAFVKLFGYSLDELQGTKITLSVKNQPGIELSQTEVYEIARDQGVYRGETLRVTKEGKVLPIQRHISPVKDKTGALKGYVSVLTDISEKKKAEEIIWRQANFDALTGLPNRFMFMQKLKDELKKIKRSQSPLGLMFLDLDRFKEINDTLGHDMGDILLKEAASRIVGCLRGTDVIAYLDNDDSVSNNVARLGGDEFTIILNDLKEDNATDIVATRVLNKLAEPFLLGNDLVHVTGSIGIVETYPNETIDAEALIKYADIAMYESKHQGRNRYTKFDQSMLHNAQQRSTLINDIHRALKDNQFQVVYQPIIDIKSNQILKAEALIRWHHPVQGLINPDDFISVAEDAGLIIDVGNWVFKQVVQQVAVWRKTIHPNFQISINKSPVQLNIADSSKLDWLACLEANKVPGESVIVEITENVFLNKSPLVTKRLSSLRDAGMQISLDDFGTGYSSLSYLLKMDIDYIKIDQSFVENLSANTEDFAICEAMIVMAHKLGIKVVAEGVEKQEQLNLLADAGCDYAQGFLLAKPLSSKAFERLCKKSEDSRLIA
jgi:diguanylate cyclase (GGDEF)-like protein/PAS domain S-box-containing protein